MAYGRANKEYGRSEDLKIPDVCITSAEHPQGARIGLAPSPFHAPRTVRTPVKPMRSPITWYRFGFSSRNRVIMTSNVIRGVTAFMIPAKSNVWG